MAQFMMMWAIIGAVVFALVIAVLCVAFKLGRSSARNGSQTAPTTTGLQVVQVIPRAVHQQTAPIPAMGVRVVPLNQTPIQLTPDNVEVIQIKVAGNSNGPVGGAESAPALPL